MKTYKFLFSSKWAGYFVMALIFAIACVALGNWQMNRRNEVVADIAKITANYSSAPVPYSTMANDFAHFDSTKEWTQVTMKGVYKTADQRVVRNRPLNGQPGYEVLVPLTLDNGDTVIIDRGWLPIGDKDPGHPDSVPQPASGEVTVVARLRPAEAKLNRGAPAGQLASIELGDYATQLSYPIKTGAYAQLATESPAAAVNPIGFPAPSIDEGSHLSYAMQWICFGVLAFVGFGYAARMQRRNDEFDELEAAETGIPVEEIYGRGSAFHPRRLKKVKKPGARASAEEEEDALLDSQGF
ncbi:cytochrome oxidase biogenesis protein Surf1, facilitates heme A insertion [Arthrobacter sp. ERGS1:01]|uniref:SURF1 family cytochrome oxidase biogenesis protein n=1 Tax=Arthrobacter sp. ERGS1:01 TaxID=1704044 RepID=UPI0006B60E53|nr:SURF1 family protein [Arthrobacter sp. ERGS1:01]ALE05954.1 cytochrome oxidase biogenesis protein Surf1, facilitates heme A insertion [Arthrobacter sp. ERGS1:01]